MAKLIYLQGLADRRHTCTELIDSLNLDIQHGPWIAGGAAISLYTKQVIHDIDVYVTNRQQQLDLEQLFVDKHTITYESENALSVNVELVKDERHKVQLIRKGLYKKIEEVFDTFDFSVCQIATDGKGNFVATPQALADLGTKRLRVAHFSPASFMPRWAKYTMYGFELPPIEFADYVSKINDTQFNDIYKFNNSY